MSDWLKIVADALKLAPRYLFAVAVVAGLLLFLPRHALELLGVDKLSDDYRKWFGLTFLASAVLCAIFAAIAVKIWIQRKLRQSKAENAIIERLNNLTEDEKQILRYYVQFRTRTNVLRIDDGVVQGLSRAGVIYVSAKVGSLLEGFAHNLTEIAWEYLQVHPEVLDGTTDTYRTDKRPGFWD